MVFLVHVQKAHGWDKRLWCDLMLFHRPVDYVEGRDCDRLILIRY